MTTTAMRTILATILLLGFMLTADAQTVDSGEQSVSPQPSLPTTPLADLTEVVARKSGKTFLVNRHVEPDVVVGQLRVRDVDYDDLLIVLRNNDLAAVANGDTVTIVPVQIVRQHELPLLFDDDDSIADAEWVTRVVVFENVAAAHLVPIMRPMMPRAGHLAALPSSNAIVFVDRYANVKRISAMMLALDAQSPPQSRQE